jgi:hypothetical protein
MRYQRVILLAIAFDTLVGLLVGCSQGSVRLGWVETSAPGRVKATYREFTGTETRALLSQTGDTIYLEFDAEVDRGNLHLEVDDPYGEPVWSIDLCQDFGETLELPVERVGSYTIRVRGEATEGGFDLKWRRD